MFTLRFGRHFARLWTMWTMGSLKVVLHDGHDCDDDVDGLFDVCLLLNFLVSRSTGYIYNCSSWKRQCPTGSQYQSAARKLFHAKTTPFSIENHWAMGNLKHWYYPIFFAYPNIKLPPLLPDPKPPATQHFCYGLIFKKLFMLGTIQRPRLFFP